MLLECTALVPITLSKCLGDTITQVPTRSSCTSPSNYMSWSLCSCVTRMHVFSSWVEGRLVGFVWFFFMGKHISGFSGLTSWNMRMVGKFNRSCRRKCMLLPCGHRMRRFNALEHCPLDAAEYALFCRWS